MATYIDVIFYDHLFEERERERERYAKVNDLGIPNFTGIFHFSIITTIGVIVIGNCN